MAKTTKRGVKPPPPSRQYTSVERDVVGVGIGSGKRTVYRKPKLEKPFKAKPYKNNDRWHYNGL
jgi:hypothetical protein